MRYSRQIIYEKLGEEKQKVIAKASATIVGCGALGSTAAELLARAGIGELKLIDRDIVEESNLQRQSLFTEADVGKSKARACETWIRAINRSVKVKAHPEELNCSNLRLLDSDIVLDCTDNIATRLLINEYCRKNSIPWIYTAVIGTTGMLLNIIPKRKYCLRCVIKEVEGLDTCETRGILNTTPRALVAMQVTEALKIITKQPCEKSLVYFDLWNLKLEKVNVKQNPNCPVCKGKYDLLDNKEKEIVKFCGSSSFQLKGKYDYEKLKKKLAKEIGIDEHEDFFTVNGLTVFRDRVLVKAKGEKEAKSLYSKYVGN
ncbi:MAG: HesA/MoeB/ThiF family protein [Candidatus Woesearchaeota archaeon]